MHITHFIRNLHNQKLQHYVLGKNPTSVQNTIMLVQKKDIELEIIERLHNHDLGHEIINISPSQNDKSNEIGPCQICNGLHFIKDCDETMFLDVNLISIIICHLNAIGNVTSTDNLATILFTTVTLLMYTK